MGKNLFLNAYGRRIDEIIHELQSVSMMSIPTGNIKLSEVANILNGSKLEITKLEEKVKEKDDVINELIEENKRLNQELFGTTDQ